ncbi:MAG: RNA ligase family protein [Pseudomonadota bacterium]
MDIIKFPRTRHIEGSRLQPGDLDDGVPLRSLAGAALVVAEKLDGANAALSFAPDGQLFLQSRGHVLTGGGLERHFALFKTWATSHAARLFARIGARFIIYGEWLYAKHTVFYDQLPHYFCEFDVWDREAGCFLSTPARRDLIGGLPIMPVPERHEGALRDLKALRSLIGPTPYKSPGWRAVLRQAATEAGTRPDRVDRQTEDSDLVEGLYLKREADGTIAERFKFVRADFAQAVAAADSHWLSRPILPNRLAAGVDIFAPRLGLPGAYDG